MTSSGGSIKERIAYTPYGEASQRLHEDINNAGIVDGGDIGFITNSWGATIGSPGYNPDADLNGDGTINGSDIGPITNNYNATGALPGQLSSFANTVGYSGYVYDDATNLSLARFRWYDAESGRWATRDPLEYYRGSFLYEYSSSNPITLLDTLGLLCLSGDGTEDGLGDSRCGDPRNNRPLNECLMDAKNDYMDGMKIADFKRDECIRQNVAPRQRMIDRMLRGPNRWRRFWNDAPRWGDVPVTYDDFMKPPGLRFWGGKLLEYLYQSRRPNIIYTVLVAVYNTGKWIYDVEPGVIEDIIGPGDRLRLNELFHNRDLMQDYCSTQHKMDSQGTLQRYIKRVDYCFKRHTY